MDHKTFLSFISFIINNLKEINQHVRLDDSLELVVFLYQGSWHEWTSTPLVKKISQYETIRNWISSCRWKGRSFPDVGLFHLYMHSYFIINQLWSSEETDDTHIQVIGHNLIKENVIVYNVFGRANEKEMRSRSTHPN